MFLYIISVCVILLLFINKWRNRHFTKLASFFKPLVKSYPIVGIGYYFLGNNESRMKAIQYLGRLLNNDGDGVTCAWFGLNLYFMVSVPDIAELFLKTCLEKDDCFKVLSLIVGNGNIVAPVPIWRHRRKKLVPMFTPRNLNNITSIFIRKSEILVKQLKPKVGTGPFPMWHYLNTCVMDSVCESVLGVNLDIQRNPDQPFLKACSEGLRLVTERGFKPWLSDFVYKCLPQYKKLNEGKEVMYTFIKQIIASKRKVQDPLSGQPEENIVSSFLEQLITSAGYNDLELLEESLVLVVAGTDTAAISMGFTLLMLARYPEVQDKVYAELQTVFGDTKRPFDTEDLQKLKYLEVIIKESLRLFPPAPGIMRKVTKDVILPSGVTVLEGCGVFINIWALHRNQAYWGDDAEEFRPERFLEEPFKHPAQYMPFSFGPRNCPGYHYGLMNMKITLATLLRQYRVLPPTEGHQKPIRCTIELMMTDADDFIVQLESRY